MARLEKRQEKEAKRIQRKEHKVSPDSPEALGSVEDIAPLDLDTDGSGR